LKQPYEEYLAKQAEMAKKQDGTNVGIAEIMKMLKNQPS